MIATAFWIEAPGRGALRSEAIPDPAAGEVRVRTLYTGISRGTESLVFRGEVPAGERFRLGGMVVKGSIEKTPGSLDVHFLVTDYKHTVPVTYSKILPDLFRDGQGVVAHGRMQAGVFVADEVLAKHDEKYMPPEVARSLKDNPPPPEASPGAT
jgi:cytochrome c-type biogenesis protein CcmE